MISALEWVPAGVADPNPKKYELSAAEVELIQMMENQNFQEGADVETKAVEKDKKKKKKTSKKVEHNLPADLRMDEYSSDEDENDAVQGTTIGRLLVDDAEEEIMGNETFEGGNADERNSDKMDSGDSDEDDEDHDDFKDLPDTREYTPVDVEALNALGISHIGTNAPAYMNFGQDGEVDDDDSEAEDVQLQPDDAIVVVAKTEEDFATLEVLVYEQKTGNLFVHHDIPLPAFPLCLAHGDISPSGGAGNFCAVGTFNPGIEIWNLDVLNALEPSCVLGGEDTSMADEIMRHNMLGGRSKAPRGDGAGSSLKNGSHADAIMSLSWNSVHRQVIASGSADCTVKLWDVTQANSAECNAATFRHHKGKVQSVLWHPKEGTLLATGSYDRTVALVDARNSDESVKRAKLPADCETLAWDPFNPQCLTAASEDGSMICWDVRKFSEKTPLWQIVANEYGGISDLSYNPHVPGMLASCAVDKTVTLWDIHNQENGAIGAPKACGNKEMGVGKLYTVNFYPSRPWLLGCGGGGKEIALWDMSREAAIQTRFGGRLDDSATSQQQIPEEETGNNRDDFDAMMSSDPVPQIDETPKKKTGENKKKNKKTGNKKKKKVHRAGR